MTDIIIEKRLINLNSSNATNKYNGTYLSNVDFCFTNILADDPNIINIQGGVLDCIIPVSYYTINYANNILSYTISGVVFSITISVGNYNFNTLATELLARFSANGHNIVTTINKNSGILTFTYTGASTFDSFNYLGSTCFKILGFNPKLNYTTTANVLTAPYLLNLLGFKKIKVSSLVFNTGAYDSSVLSSSNLICSIPVNASSYGLLIYNNIDTTYGNLKLTNISTVDIQLYNEDNVFINFNNTDWTMTLCLLIYRKYKTDVIQPLILDTLRQLDTNIQNLQQSYQAYNEVNQQPDLGNLQDLGNSQDLGTQDNTEDNTGNTEDQTDLGTETQPQDVTQGAEEPQLDTGDASILEEQPIIGEPIIYDNYLNDTENDTDMAILNYLE